MKHQLPDSEVVEVVMRREMSFGRYKKLLKSKKLKDWQVRAYELGRFSNRLRTEIKEK